MHALRITMILTLIAASTFLIGCSGESPVAPADEGGAAAGILKSNTVAFHAKVRNTIQVLPPFPPPTIHAIFEGEGKSRPFGPFVLYATSQVDVTVYPFVQTTDYTLTFRNGDQLFATSVGTSTEDPPGTAQFQGEFTWVGGTGIFANATGGGSYGGSADTNAGTGMWSMDGDISGFGGPGH